MRRCDVRSSWYGAVRSFLACPPYWMRLDIILLLIPQFAASAIAAYEKNAHIAADNVVGSNTFNVSFMLGVSAPIARPPSSEKGSLGILVLTVVEFSILTDHRMGDISDYYSAPASLQTCMPRRAWWRET